MNHLLYFHESIKTRAVLPHLSIYFIQQKTKLFRSSVSLKLSLLECKISDSQMPLYSNLIFWVLCHPNENYMPSSSAAVLSSWICFIIFTCLRAGGGLLILMSNIYIYIYIYIYIFVESVNRDSWVLLQSNRIEKKPIETFKCPIRFFIKMSVSKLTLLS